MPRLSILQRINKYLRRKQDEPIAPTGAAQAPLEIQTDAETQSGSPFPSPTLDKWIQQGLLANDIMARAALYSKLESYQTEPIYSMACITLTHGAIGNHGFSYSVRPVEDTEDAKFQAQLALEVLRPLRTLLPPRVLRQWAYTLGFYGNCPVQLVVNRSSEIVQMVCMPPYGFQINSDETGQFRPNQTDCYIQYDTQTWQPIPDGKFTEAQIVWGAINRKPWQRYGTPPGAFVIADIEALIDAWKDLADARKSAIPRKVIHTHDGEGKPVATDSVKRLLYFTIAERLKRNEPVTAYDMEVLNGAQDMKLLEDSGNYLSDISDIKSRAERVTMVYQLPIGIFMGLDEASNTTIEELVQLVYSAQQSFALDLEEQLILPVFYRALRFAGIKTHLLDIDIIWSERKTPKQLLQEAESAVRWAGTKTVTGEAIIDSDSARRIACNYLGLSPETVAIKVEEEHAKAQEEMLRQQQLLMQQGQQGQPGENGLPGQPGKPGNSTDGPSLQGGVLDTNKKNAAAKYSQAYTKREAAGLKQNEKSRPSKPGVEK